MSSRNEVRENYRPSSQCYREKKSCVQGKLPTTTETYLLLLEKGHNFSNFKYNFLGVL